MMHASIQVVGVSLLVASAVIPGCGPTAEQYRTIHRSARTALPIAVEMEEIFGTADHFITHFGARSETPNRWNTEVYFGGRYTLTMQVDVAVDYDNNRIAVVGEPKMYLVEVTSIEVFSDGRTASKYGKNYTLSGEEWKKVYEHRGDFSAIGLKVDPNPVEGFDAYVASLRGSRVPISLLDGK